MALRQYTNAPATTLAAPCTNLATSITVASITGFPISYPYILILDRGTASEEVVLVTGGSGVNLTVTRGYDSTTAFSHSTGAVVEHGISAIDPREANTHVNATSGVHGATGSVVGTSDTQTLTNKTLGSTNTINGFTASRFMEADSSGKLASGSKTIPSGTVVGTSDTQTLTNKTISADNNTLSGIAASSFVLSDASGNIDGAAAQKAVPAGVVVGTTDTQTLTNKTLTSPIITGPGSVVGAVKATDQGRQVQAGVQDDADLSVTIEAGTWIFDLFLNCTADTTGNDLLANVTATGTVTMMRYGIQGPELAMTSTASTPMKLTMGTFSGDNLTAGLNTAFCTVKISGSVITTTSGTLKLRWGANGGLTTEQVYVIRGSNLIARRVA